MLTSRSQQTHYKKIRHLRECLLFNNKMVVHIYVTSMCQKLKMEMKEANWYDVWNANDTTTVR